MSINLIRPVGGFVSSPFGMRGGVLHAGVDLAVGKGTPIHAAAAGTVTRASWFDGYGNCVDINHGGNVMTRYGHQMQAPSVKVGQTVTQGQVIGYVGATGDASGNHLHFEVRINGKAVDPWPYINGKAVPSDAATPTVQDASLLDPRELGATVGGIKANIDAWNKVAAAYTDPHLWIRTGMLITGAVSVGIGLLFLTGNDVKQVGKGVNKYVKAAGSIGSTRAITSDGQ